ncbi:MAG: protein kinase [Gammaproteobacteria bacterium]|nr:protein kinase [Gammaproteobacteria bacterium]NNC97710.1 protein kinase [Gammaproteobacteria bacterium]NNM14046.1 protein kinase [Gammaproteobacteria bacterium]
MAEIFDKLGKYVIVNKVGKGSTGDIYLAHDPFYGRDVAIKVYKSDHLDEHEEEAQRKMFFNEAHMVGMLQHPNILPIYDAGEEEGRYFVVMEFIHGARTLSSYTKKDKLLRMDDVLEIIFKVAKALHYAHGRGVVHRDIKPSNIMLTMENDVRIIDFGIAMVQNAELSTIDGIAGSPSYMAPEQIESKDITMQTDLFSLGVVMYEMLTGARPFVASSLSKLLHQIVYSTPIPMHTVRNDVPEVLEDITMRAMQKEPSRRYGSGLEFAADLTNAFQHLNDQEDILTQQEHFSKLRRLKFFHDFSYPEIWEVMRASVWNEYSEGQEIVKEGEMDDCFYIIVEGEVGVVSGGRTVGHLRTGDGFGETGYLQSARRSASIMSEGDVTVLRVRSTLLEQASAACQLQFNKVFLRTLIRRLQS